MIHLRSASLLFAAALTTATLRAVTPAPGAAQPYRANRTDPHTLRIWGDPGLRDLLGIWEADYGRLHPEIRFENRLQNTAFALPGLYTGITDIGVLGREMDVEDHDGFVHVRNYEPLRVEIATGSLATPGKSPALAVLVSEALPLTRLTLVQLDGLCGAERLRGGPPVRTWGDLGVAGPKASRPIHVYLRGTETGTGQYFLRAVLGGSHKVNWDRVTELDSDDAIARAVRRDRDGLGLCSLPADPGGLKALELSRDAAGPFAVLTPANLISRAYPLTRAAVAYVNRPPGRPLDPKVAAFLDFVRSPAGQADIAREGAFLPLP